MDPHFLFNVLDSIAWKASISDNDDIYQMVISLGELMRMNILAKDNEMVTLEQELNYIRFYLHLQQNRFEGKYETEIIVDEPCLTFLRESNNPRYDQHISSLLIKLNAAG